jgi:hypothetical protein
VATRIPSFCRQCGQPFQARASTRALGMAYYCSKSCSNSARAVPLANRFWNSVQKSDGCWLWTGTIDKDGYGVTSERNGTQIRAHRVSYELHNGPITDGRYVLHRCDNRPCVNPDHLWLGTTTENTADMVAKNRQAKGERHGRAKLTSDQVREARRLYSTGEHSMRSLGIRFGISGVAMSMIINRRHHANVT